MKTTIQVVKRWLASLLVIGFVGMSFGEEPATDEVLKLKEKIRQLEKEKSDWNKAFWDLYAIGVMDQAWVALNINSGTEKPLAARIQSDLPNYVQALTASPVKDAKVTVSALWMVKAYYEKSQVPIPAEIKATLAALPEKPPTSCQLRLRELESSSPRSPKSVRSQVLDDVVVTLDGYSQDAGSAWHAVFVATNGSSMKIGCMAFSYAAGLPRGSLGIVTTNLDAGTLPKHLVWTRRQPEMRGDPWMMERYGTGRVFELQPGAHLRFSLPIVVPQTHPNDFVEHLVFGYRSPSSSGVQGEYETYVAELKR